MTDYVYLFTPTSGKKTPQISDNFKQLSDIYKQISPGLSPKLEHNLTIILFLKRIEKS